MVVLGVVAGVLAWIAGWFVAGRWVRRRAERIAATEPDVPRAVHRLQRLSLASFGSVFLVLVVAGGITGAVAGNGGRHHHDGTPVYERIAAVALALILVFVPMLVMARTVRPVLARVRGVPTRLPDRRRRLIAAVIMVACWVAVLAGGDALVPRHGTAHAVGHVLVFVVGIVLIVTIAMPLVLVHIQTRPMPEPHRERMQALATRMGVHVHDFRVLKGRQQKTANAAQFGAVPGLRYVMITDYLLDHLTPGQLDAVVAHELGHARRHHVAIKMAAALCVWVVLEVVLLAFGSSGRHGLATIASIPLVVAIPLVMIGIQGVMGVRMERQADDIAAREVGPHELAGALETLADLNHTQRRTGRGWAVLTQHPGIQERLDRLRAEHEPARTSGQEAATVG